MTTKRKSTKASPRKGGRRPKPLRDSSTLDRIDTLTRFADGIGDAVRGLQALQDVECEGVLTLIDFLIGQLRILSAELAAKGAKP